MTKLIDSEEWDKRTSRDKDKFRFKEEWKLEQLLGKTTLEPLAKVIKWGTLKEENPKEKERIS